MQSWLTRSMDSVQPSGTVKQRGVLEILAFDFDYYYW